MTCKTCKQEKPSDEFYLHKGKYKYNCKACQSAASLVRHDTNRYSLKKFGITLADYQQLLEHQHFACAICGKPHQEKPAKKWGRARLAVDHDHKTGKIRGLLCLTCNRLVGQAGDSAIHLHKAIHYLLRPPAVSVFKRAA